MTAAQELAGRVALVTGAARNIGRGIALALAEAGAAVVVAARQDVAAAEAVVAEIAGCGGRAVAAFGDISREDGAVSIVSTAVDRFGRLDILVNNAAVRNERLISEMSYAQWRDVLGVALDGPFLCIRAALPHLAAAGAGRIVSIGGIAAYAGPATRAHVAAAKAGLGGLTRALARELAPQGITVNLVAPGKIDTVKVASNSTRQPESGRYEPLVGRIGRVDEIAAAVRYLVGPAGGFITGHTLHVNGGAFMA
jgi:3-oxoacyl-[acyl-carrier protein] reductase